MGTWDSGNFENDYAADRLRGLCGPLLTEIEKAMQQAHIDLEDDFEKGDGKPGDHRLSFRIPRPVRARGYPGFPLPMCPALSGDNRQLEAKVSGGLGCWSGSRPQQL